MYRAPKFVLLYCILLFLQVLCSIICNVVVSEALFNPESLYTVITCENSRSFSVTADAPREYQIDALPTCASSVRKKKISPLTAQFAFYPLGLP